MSAKGYSNAFLTMRLSCAQRSATFGMNMGVEPFETDPPAVRDNDGQFENADAKSSHLAKSSKPIRQSGH